ncbi:Growth-regulating factor [Parasponia andersonii]|uniref:Growth-regulating factor n=1 Tax=Parasponia andersonii TaxID=3476 RepID=A0A2P5CWY8_PARAD|nr:Growth-regulating factor [Parasponia andersonii]
MDIGVVMGLDNYGAGAVSDSATGFGSISSSPDPEAKQRPYGSGLFPVKQERSAAASGIISSSSSSTGLEEYLTSSKVAKTSIDDFSYCKLGMVQRNNVSSVLRSNCGQQQQQMLSFSSPKSETLMVDNKAASHNSNAATLFSCNFPNALLSAYTRNTGYNSGSLNGGNMHGTIAGIRGPFTQSQWMELEHQALIYKYITANVPIPSNLLIPIRKAIESAAFSHFPAGLLRPNTLGWGSFHLGFSNNADPEPGRCRRTDGKKWRCSRDAVADQKYCERHMNRGRHRSRKPVEGQTGATAATTTTTTTTTSKLMPMASSASSVAMPGAGGSSNSLAISNHHHQIQSLETGASNTSSATHLNRMPQQNTSGLSLLSKETSFLTGSSREFGLVPTDSLLNPSQKNTSLLNCRSFGSSRDLTDRSETTEPNQQQQQSLRHFIEDWPKSQPNRSALSWPEIDVQSDRTQLSISIPISSTDHFIPSTSSPDQKTSRLSPLRLSRELDRVPMSLGVGTGEQMRSRPQANWIPIAWENSLGGPLGEVLHHTNNSTNNNGSVECKNNNYSSSSSSMLNLMTEGWDSSPPMGSSPTGVLQKTSFGSFSNSSAGSSPRAENNKSLD